LCIAILVFPSAAWAADAENITVIGQTGQPIDQPGSQITLSAETLRRHGIFDQFDLGQVIPGLHVDRYGISTQPSLRGVGVQNVLGPGINSDVAIYLDGYYQTGLSTDIDFANVRRIDVLKGPQGQQFGQNALAGAILITTASPEFDRHGRASISYGAFNDRLLQGYLTTGLTSSLAMNLSVSARESDGYFQDIATGKPSAPITGLTIRSKFLYQPAEGARLVLAAQFSDTGNPTGIAYTVHHPAASLYHDAFGVPQVFTELPYKTSLSHRIVAGPKDWSLSLTGEFDLVWADLTTRSLFRKERNHMWSDQDGTSIPYWNADFRMRVQTASQEIDLAGNNRGRFQWHAGLHYDNDLSSLHHDSSQDIFSSGISTSQFRSDMRVATDSLALYGEATYSLAEDWLVSAAARATHERKSMRDSFLLTTPSTDAKDAASWDNLSPRLALRHVLGDEGSLYASVTQGFKSGNYNFVGVGPQTPVRPERVTQFEAGYKKAAPGWKLEAALYLSNIRDLQSSVYVATCGCFQFYNAPRAQSYGAELMAGYVLDEEFSFNAALAWTHARYQQFVGQGPTGQPLVPPNFGYATGPTDYAGGALVQSPDWTGNVGLDWHRRTEMGLWNAAVNLYLTSRVPFTPDRLLSQPGYGLLNVSLGWSTPDQLWSITASGRNITGQRYQTFSSISFLGNTLTYGTPADWTLRLERSF
jgi:iron complex outermembrane receptor protein